MLIQYLSSQILLIATITTFTLLTTFDPHIAKQAGELGCFGFYTENGNSYLFDATTGKINRLTYKPFDLSFYKSPRQVSYTPSGYISSSTNDYGNRRLFTKTEFSGKRAIYRQTHNEPPQRIQDFAELLTAWWSSDDKHVVYTWNDSTGNRHVSILVWKSGYSYTAPFQLPTSEGYFYWSRDNKSAGYVAKELSIIIDLTHPIFGIDLAHPTFRIVPHMVKLPPSKSELFVSPTRQKFTFLSPENTWKVEIINGNISRSYIVDAPLDPARAMWSPDGRYMVVGEGYRTPLTPGQMPYSSFTFLDLESGKTQTIRVTAFDYPKFLDDGHTVLITGGIGPIEVFLYDLFTQTKTVVFEGVREMIGSLSITHYLWYFDRGYFFVGINEKSRHFYRVDFRDGSLHLMEKDLDRGQFTIGRSLNRMFFARQRDGKNILSVFDTQNSEAVFTREMPGKVTEITGLPWDGEWAAIRLERDGKRYGMFLEADTHQFLETGEGLLRPAIVAGFDETSAQQVLVRQLSDNIFEYTFFDQSIVSWGPFLLPEIPIGKGKMEKFLSRDQKNALVQFRTDKAYSVWVAKTDGTRPRKLLEIPLSVKGNNASWALDEQHILIVTYKMGSHDHSEMTLFDIDGKPLWTQSFDGVIYNPPESIAC